jgi:hypothetical protein
MEPDEPTRTDDLAAESDAVTAGQLQELLAGVPSETRLLVAVRSGRHFNEVIADMRVTRVTIDHGPDGPVLLLDVPALG